MSVPASIEACVLLCCSVMSVAKAESVLLTQVFIHSDAMNTPSNRHINTSCCFGFVILVNSCGLGAGLQSSGCQGQLLLP